MIGGVLRLFLGLMLGRGRSGVERGGAVLVLEVWRAGVSMIGADGRSMFEGDRRETSLDLGLGVYDGDVYWRGNR